MSVEDFRIGAGSLAINGSDIGLTTPDGIVVNYEPNVHLHQSGKYGTTPVKASLIGVNLTIEVYFAETTKDNLVKALSGSTSADGKVKIGGIAGTDITGAVLTLTPFDGTVSWTFRNCVPTSAVEVAYQVENERVYQVTFTAMVDTTKPEAENIAFAS
jgi:hypothetical protein